MRPKLFAIVAVSAFALVGCATNEDPVATQQTIVEPATSEPEQVVPTEGPYAERSAEEFYVDSLVHTFESGKNNVPESLHYKVEEAYIMERGEYYCDKVEAGKEVEQIRNLDGNIEDEIENRIILSATMFLCPSEPESTSNDLP